MILMDKIMCSFHIFPLNNELIEEWQRNGEYNFFVREQLKMELFRLNFTLAMSLRCPLFLGKSYPNVLINCVLIKKESVVWYGWG